jgi:SAM-dependent methyltransferase
MHQVMLADQPRIAAYDAALGQAVRPGDVVVDVGAGTLVLSMLALRHGAGHVYAIEADPQMAAVADRIATHNGLGDKVTVIQGNARAVRLPRKADVVVSEMMGNLGPEEEMAEVLAVVAKRNLKPGGRIVPERLRTVLAPIQFDGEGWGIWGDDFHGFSLDVVREYVRPAAQLHFFQRPPVQLGPAVTIADDHVGEGSSLRPRSVHRLPIQWPGRLHAVLGYFAATLAPGVTLANFPSYPGCNWAVWIWPIGHTDVAGGDVLRVELQRPKGVRVATDWTVDCSISRASAADERGETGAVLSRNRS